MATWPPLLTGDKYSHSLPFWQSALALPDNHVFIPVWDLKLEGVNSGHRSVRSDSQGGQRHWSPEGPQLAARRGSEEDTGVWWQGCQSGVLSKHSWATASAMVPPAWLPLVAAHLWGWMILVFMLTLRTTLHPFNKFFFCYVIQGWFLEPRIVTQNLSIHSSNKVFYFSFFFFFWSGHTACRILVARPAIKSMPPAVEVWSPNH